jgi:glycosyltransferase involved in cell wall biosynthesis
MIRRVHMVEPGGQGGVYNHSVEVAAELHGIGVDVVVHTADDHDAAPGGVDICGCVSWYRDSSSRFIRRTRTTLRYLSRTLPHLARVIDADDIVHVQGSMALMPEVITVAKARGATVVCSPHNTFVRENDFGITRVLSSMLRRADRVLVYSDADLEILADRVKQLGRVPLVQFTPPVDQVLRDDWRRRLAGDGSRLAVMPGYLRSDKNIDVFVEAVAMMPGWRGAVVGEANGLGEWLDGLIERTGSPVTTEYRYITVEEFVALVAAADVVAAPYRVASQSGVLSVAARLGVPRAAAATGGLAELATAVTEEMTPAGLRDAMLAAFATGATPIRFGDAAGTFLKEYVVAHERRRSPASARRADG